jgi:hypothetical protein
MGIRGGRGAGSREQGEQREQGKQGKQKRATDNSALRTYSGLSVTIFG